MGRKTNSVEDFERYKLLTAAYNEWKSTGEYRLQVKIPTSLFITKGQSMRFYLVRDDLLELEVRSHFLHLPETLVAVGIPSDIAVKFCPALFNGSRGTYPLKIGLTGLFGLQAVEEAVR